MLVSFNGRFVIPNEPVNQVGVSALNTRSTIFDFLSIAAIYWQG